LGIFGLITVTIFMISSSIEAIRYKKLFEGDNFMNRYYTYLLAVYLTQVVIFFVFFGDTISYVPSIMYSLALIKVVVRTRKAELGAEKDNNVEPAAAISAQGVT
jgi:hypothetical protein